jgi:hypothetical protein
VLTRDTLYDELPVLERARLHERVGLALEANHRDHLAPHLGALAHHFSAAVPVGSSAKAIACAIAAGEQARAQLAYEEAARCFGLALSVLDHAAVPDAELRRKLVISLATAQMKSGHAVRAVDALTEAANQASHVGAASDLAQAAIELEEAAWRLGLPGMRAVGLLERSLEQLPRHDGITRARLQSALARALAFAGDVERTGCSAKPFSLRADSAIRTRSKPPYGAGSGCVGTRRASMRCSPPLMRRSRSPRSSATRKECWMAAPSACTC